eukprot:TRINITY_DN8010_c0_g2_i5.p1 TRINITY_DN8010_c0_g2~~TRINITY_DN8010_c0_g2_i5.p1  ORF type:complete len:115 (+),score=9.00 TRINITY_DN8010_c0_g2_i5:141-485(+)
MLRSLVGSEMCIRDRCYTSMTVSILGMISDHLGLESVSGRILYILPSHCQCSTVYSCPQKLGLLCKFCSQSFRSWLTHMYLEINCQSRALKVGLSHPVALRSKHHFRSLPRIES